MRVATRVATVSWKRQIWQITIVKVGATFGIRLDPPGPANCKAPVTFLRTKDKNAEIPTSNSTGQATKEMRQGKMKSSTWDFLLLERRGERPVLSLTTQLATGLADGQEQVDHSTFWQPSFIPPGRNDGAEVARSVVKRDK